jgi:hypothetical protein
MRRTSTREWNRLLLAVLFAERTVHLPEAVFRVYQFVSLLDVNGMALEINRAALEGAGIQLKDIQGRPFWEARWWQVCSETREKQCELS